MMLELHVGNTELISADITGTATSAGAIGETGTSVTAHVTLRIGKNVKEDSDVMDGEAVFGTPDFCGAPKCRKPAEMRFANRLWLCTPCFSLVTEQETGGGSFTARCKKLRKAFGLPLEPTTVHKVDTAWKQHEQAKSVGPRDLPPADTHPDHDGGDSLEEVSPRRARRRVRVADRESAGEQRDVDILGAALNRLSDFDPFK